MQRLGNHFRDEELDNLVDQLGEMLNLNEYEDISKVCIINNNITSSGSNSIEVNGKVSTNNCEAGISATTISQYYKCQ